MEWLTHRGLLSYPVAVTVMEQHIAAIHHQEADDRIWLVEHPPLYTAGSSAKPQDLIHPRFPVYETGRGGQYTYHGPGQRVVYVMMDLKKRQKTPDIKLFVWQLEEWVIRTLAEFGIEGERRTGRVGIWVTKPPVQNRANHGANNGASEYKIAAIGVRIRHWVSYHGFAINIDPDLDHFNGIIPCGLKDFGVTSLADLGVKAGMKDVDDILRQNFSDIF